MINQWNEWRRKNQQIVINLRGADLSDANLRYADLYDADLRDANLRGANLRGAAVDTNTTVYFFKRRRCIND